MDETRPCINQRTIWQDYADPEAKTEMESEETTLIHLKDIVDWLRTVEEFAYKLYSRSSEFFAPDKDLSRFLARLADDELWHYHLMGSASEFMAERSAPLDSSIDVDPEVVDHVEKPLRAAYDQLAEGTLTQRRIIESVIAAESSEWNMLFLYAINSLKSISKLFEQGASVIQSHQDRIQRFLALHPDGRDHVDAIRQLPPVWRPRFLVVDDEQPLRILLSDLLAARGVVETAPDGRVALDMTRRHFFDVIVSDIHMPRMNGLDFYKNAVENDPTVSPRFVFCSGEIGPDQEMVFRENDIPYVRKPFKVNELIKLLDHTLQRSHEVPVDSAKGV